LGKTVRKAIPARSPLVPPSEGLAASRSSTGTGKPHGIAKGAELDVH